MDVNIVIVPEAVALVRAESSHQILTKLSELYAGVYGLDAGDVLDGPQDSIFFTIQYPNRALNIFITSLLTVQTALRRYCISATFIKASRVKR